MTSPINNINRAATNALTNNASKTESKNSAESTSGSASQPAADDTVSISKESVHIRELQQQLDSISEIDSEKVDAIKQEIAKGNYPIDSNSIAENLINLEKALLE
jgi:negative regulator of flagellin synthesis FlgM